MYFGRKIPLKSELVEPQYEIAQICGSSMYSNTIIAVSDVAHWMYCAPTNFTPLKHIFMNIHFNAVNENITKKGIWINRKNELI